MVCDDESNETVASTVVNCMKIDEGNEKKIYDFFSLWCKYITYVSLQSCFFFQESFLISESDVFHKRPLIICSRV